MIEWILNREPLLSVRQKLNALIDRVNNLNVTDAGTHEGLTGQISRIGDYGIGSTTLAQGAYPGNDLNNTDVRNGIYAFSVFPEVLNRPFAPGETNCSGVVYVARHTSNTLTQIVVKEFTTLESERGAMYTRTFQNVSGVPTWFPWRRVWDSTNRRSDADDDARFAAIDDTWNATNRRSDADDDARFTNKEATGFGSASVPFFPDSDLNDPDTVTGIYTYVGSNSTPNIPKIPGETVHAGTILNVRSGNNVSVQLAMASYSDDAADRAQLFTRTRQRNGPDGAGDIWYDWSQIWGSNNRRSDSDDDALFTPLNDGRLTNSREWTATTIAQSEAEAGTASTRRAWTAQRVRQAILGWWNNSSEKTKLDGIETGAQVNSSTFATDLIVHDTVTVGRGGNGGFTNIAFGRNALAANISGGGNVAIGPLALEDHTSGNNNTAVGNQSLKDSTTSSNNTAVGNSTLGITTTGTDNTAIGSNALWINTVGVGNTALGASALGSLTTGSNNIGIGRNAGRSGSQPNPIITITDQDDHIVIGNNNHTNALVKVAWTVTSDARDKMDFAEVPHGLDFINALKPTEYKFIKGERDSGVSDGIRRYGFLAQDILPLEGDSPVIINNSDPENLKYNEAHLIPVLVKAVQELTQQVLDLKDEIAEIKSTLQN